MEKRVNQVCVEYSGTKKTECVEALAYSDLRDQCGWDTRDKER